MAHGPILYENIHPLTCLDILPLRSVVANIPARAQVRMMLPMSIRCNSCGTYIYKGTKFNSRKEDADETYLGIKIIRLYFRCPQCASELAIKTDPKNSDYVVELGATRNFEPSREREHEKVEAEAERQREEEVRTKYAQTDSKEGGEQTVY